MNRTLKGIGLLISLLFVSSFSACKYGSMMEARIACNKWADERKGEIEVDDDGDGKKGRMVENLYYYLEKDTVVDPPPQKYIHRNGETIINLRECTLEEETQQFIGIEYITPYEELISKEKYDKIEARYKNFPY